LGSSSCREWPAGIFQQALPFLPEFLNARDRIPGSFSGPAADLEKPAPQHTVSMQFLFSGTEFECMRFQVFQRFPTAGSTGSTPGSMISHSADLERLGTPPRQSGWWELWPQLSRAVLRCFKFQCGMCPFVGLVKCRSANGVVENQFVIIQLANKERETQRGRERDRRTDRQR
jgi:hypothetical protein